MPKMKEIQNVVQKLSREQESAAGGGSASSGARTDTKTYKVTLSIPRWLNCTIVLGQVNLRWGIWVKKSHDSIENDTYTITKKSKTKWWAYLHDILYTTHTGKQRHTYCIQDVLVSTMFHSSMEQIILPWLSSLIFNEVEHKIWPMNGTVDMGNKIQQFLQKSISIHHY